MTAEDLSPEFRLLCACCQAKLGGEFNGNTARHPQSPSPAESAPRSGPAEQINWPLFLKMVERHRVSGLVFRALQGCEIPSEVQETLKKAAAAQTRFAARLALETELVQRILSRAGVPAVYPKGVGLARRLYGDFAFRHTRDVDVFTTPEAMHAAHAALLAAGYRQTEPEAPFRDIRHVAGHSVNYKDPMRGLLIELHWLFDENPILHAKFMSCTSALSGQADQPSQSPSPIKTAPLASGELTIYLALHGAGHNWMRLKWLADFSALLPQLDDLPGILREAKACGLIRPLASALILTRDLLGWEMPEEIAAMLPKSRTLRAMVRSGRAQLTRGDGALGPWTGPFASTRLRLIRFRLSPDPRFLVHEAAALVYDFFIRNAASTAAILPRPLKPFAPLLKIPLWLWKHLRGGRKTEKRAGS